MDNYVRMAESLLSDPRAERALVRDVRESGQLQPLPGEEGVYADVDDNPAASFKEDDK